MPRDWGELIRKHRLEKELSQSDLGGRVGVSQPCISQWENEITEVPERYWKKLERILGPFDAPQEHEESATSPLVQRVKDVIDRRVLSARGFAEEAGLSYATIRKILNMKNNNVGNLRDRTREKLEAVLRKLEDAPDSSGPNEERTEGLPETIDSAIGDIRAFDPNDLDGEKGLPANAAGVYMLYDQHGLLYTGGKSEKPLCVGKPVYVGQSNNVKGRIRDHRNLFWYRGPVVESGIFIEVKDENLRKQMEKVLIRLLRPMVNIQLLRPMVNVKEV